MLAVGVPFKNEAYVADNFEFTEKSAPRRRLLRLLWLSLSYLSPRRNAPISDKHNRNKNKDLTTSSEAGSEVRYLLAENQSADLIASAHPGAERQLLLIQAITASPGKTTVNQSWLTIFFARSGNSEPGTLKARDGAVMSALSCELIYKTWRLIMKAQIKALLLASTALLLTTCLMPPFTALAGWTPDPWNGMVEVTNLPGEDGGPKIMRLGSGNYFVEWWHRDVTDEDPGKSWYQILDSFGNPLLGSTGNLILPGATWSYGSAIYLLPDGMGGVIAVFRDLRLGSGTGSIYGQRFDQWGQPLWGSTGLPLVVWSGHDTPLADAVNDENGNIFIAWGLNAGWNNTDLYAQKVTTDGAAQWGPYGVPVSIASQNQSYPQIVGDGTGGMVSVWESGIGTDYSLWTQHLDANGNSLLTFNGVPLQLSCGGLADGVPDGEEGGVFVYTTGGSYWNALKAIRVSSRGQLVWIWDSGVQALHAITGVMQHPDDGTIWIAENDNRTGPNLFYLYHLDLNGNLQYDPPGQPYGDGGIIAPTDNGVIYTKVDEIAQGTRLLAQRVNSDGTLIWTSTVALGGFTQGGGPIFGAIACISDGSNGLAITFEDRRQELIDVSNLAAQRVRSNGEIGNPTPSRYHIPGGQVQIGGGLQSLPGNLIQYTLSQPSKISLDLYDILGRHVAKIDDGTKEVGMYVISLSPIHLTSGMYVLRLASQEGVQTIKIPLIR